MFKNKNKYSIKKIIIGVILTLSIIFATLYLIIPKFVSKNSTQNKITSTFQFSRPDNRPDEIKGQTITLKRLQPYYYKEYFEKINYPEVLKPLYFPKKLSFKWIEEYLDEEIEKETEGETFLYLIFDNNNNELIGSVEIREPNPKDPGQYGCWITPKYWGTGKLQEAFKLLVENYFKIQPNVEKFNAHVEMWNLRSYYALKKCGFKLVKTLHFKTQPSRYLLEYYKEPQK
ncbi:MAG: GNAT family protein [bacterium]